MLKQIMGRLFLILFGIAISVLMIEIILRVGFDLLPPAIQGEIQNVRRAPWDEEKILEPIPMLPDRTFQTVLGPGHVDRTVKWMDAQFEFTTINFEDWEHPVGLRTDPNPIWPIDIIGFGDSFTFCWTQVEDCWVQLLQSEYGWSVINAGQPGTGPGGQLQLIKDVAIPIEPKLVIWQWYSNDLFDEYVFHYWREETPGLRGAPAVDPERPLTSIGQYSAVYTLLYNRLNPPEKTSSYEHSQWVTINGRRMLVATNEYTHGSNTSYDAAAYGFESGIEAYQEGVDLLARIGAEVMFVLVPTKEEAYQTELVDTLGETWFEESTDSRYKLLDVCEERGWHCIDATPALREAVDGGETIFYAKDFHLDALGNRVLAELVNNYIVEHGLLDEAQ